MAQPPDEVRDTEARASDPVEGIEAKRLDDDVEAGLHSAVVHAGETGGLAHRARPDQKENQPSRSSPRPGLGTAYVTPWPCTRLDER